MSVPTTRSAAIAVAVVVGLAIAGCAAPGSDDGSPVTVITTANPHGYRGAYLDQPYRPPQVSLVDTAGRGQPFATRMTKRATLVVFVYTHCPDVCPTVLADLASALRRTEQAVRAQIDVFVITTDPDRDTPEVLREYLDRFDPSFVGLTGSLEEIKAAADALGVPLSVEDRLPGGGYDIGHGAQIIGFGADRAAHLVWTQGTPVGDLRHDLAILAG